eukprot:gnl/TRDRNA2_/TRDRNA2_183985_c0_seq1.p1 gnl/TRDRNA2_/TRDRNA2_183985_c0~~gnl/TRDRNA2_/TRDRNA2_183985_c0_seq1.p1  ORF type:complete len:432 (+),score=95.58 gnl/TRDRNA2_/TRDRNA2_183985_c0_seq1:109-1404(+)
MPSPRPPSLQMPLQRSSPALPTAEADESSAGSRAKRVAHVVLVLMIGCAYFLCSAGLIIFNKYLMHKDRFPFAVPLVLLHSAFASVLSLILYWVAPSLFPSLRDPEPERRIVVDADLMFRGVVPVAVLFSAHLVLANTAYLHSTIAFLQMMKEANLVLVYIFSLVAALERFSWRSCSILALVIGATALTIHGELNFSMTGFAMQATSQLFESLKIVLQAVLLSNAGRKLDVFTYMLLVMPLCFVILGAAMCSLIYLQPVDYFQTPQWSDVQVWWKFLLANACLAFLLNVSIALFVKHCSAVSFILAGIVKDMMIVIAGGMFLQEIISIPQYFGFAMQLCLILLWSLIKTFPDKFEGGLFSGIAASLSGYERQAEGDSMAIKSKASNYGAAGLLFSKKSDEHSTTIPDDASSVGDSEFMTPRSTCSREPAFV